MIEAFINIALFSFMAAAALSLLQMTQPAGRTAESVMVGKSTPEVVATAIGPVFVFLVLTLRDGLLTSVFQSMGLAAAAGLMAAAINAVAPEKILDLRRGAFGLGIAGALVVIASGPT